jgi:hypothetical protein
MKVKEKNTQGASEPTEYNIDTIKKYMIYEEYPHNNKYLIYIYDTIKFYFNNTAKFDLLRFLYEATGTKCAQQIIDSFIHKMQSVVFYLFKLYDCNSIKNFIVITTELVQNLFYKNVVHMYEDLKDKVWNFLERLPEILQNYFQTVKSSIIPPDAETLSQATIDEIEEKNNDRHLQNDFSWFEELISVCHKFRESFHEVICYPIVMKFTRLIQFLLTTSLAVDWGLKSYINCFDFDPSYANLPKVKTTPQFITSMMSFCLDFFDGAYQYLCKGNTCAFVHTSGSYTEWLLLSDELIRKENCICEDYDDTEGMIKSSDYFAKITKCLNHGEEIVKVISKDPTLKRDVPFIMSYVTKIRQIHYKRLNILRYSGTREPPFVFVLESPPSTGKSGLLYYIYAITMHCLGYHFKNDMVHTFVSSSNFWDGANNSKLVLTIDDYAQLRSQFGATTEVTELIKMVNSIPYILPMADLESKGNTFAQFKVIGITTNNIKVVKEYMTTPSATFRRMKHKIEVRVKEQFQLVTPGGVKTGAVDSKKLRTYCETHLETYPNFQEFRFTEANLIPEYSAGVEYLVPNDAFVYNIVDGKRVNTDDEWIEISQLSEVLITRVKAHKLKNKSEARLNASFNHVTLCPHSMPFDICPSEDCRTIWRESVNMGINLNDCDLKPLPKQEIDQHEQLEEFNKGVFPNGENQFSYHSDKVDFEALAATEEYLDHIEYGDDADLEAYRKAHLIPNPPPKPVRRGKRTIGNINYDVRELQNDSDEIHHYYHFDDPFSSAVRFVEGTGASILLTIGLNLEKVKNYYADTILRIPVFSIFYFYSWIIYAYFSFAAIYGWYDYGTDKIVSHIGGIGARVNEAFFRTVFPFSTPQKMQEKFAIATKAITVITASLLVVNKIWGSKEEQIQLQGNKLTRTEYLDANKKNPFDDGKVITKKIILSNQSKSCIIDQLVKQLKDHNLFYIMITDRSTMRKRKAFCFSIGSNDWVIPAHFMPNHELIYKIIICKHSDGFDRICDKSKCLVTQRQRYYFDKRDICIMRLNEMPLRKDCRKFLLPRSAPPSYRTQGKFVNPEFVRDIIISSCTIRPLASFGEQPGYTYNYAQDDCCCSLILGSHGMKQNGFIAGFHIQGTKCGTGWGAALTLEDLDESDKYFQNLFTPKPPGAGSQQVFMQHSTLQPYISEEIHRLNMLRYIPDGSLIFYGELKNVNTVHPKDSVHDSLIANEVRDVMGDCEFYKPPKMKGHYLYNVWIKDPRRESLEHIVTMENTLDTNILEDAARAYFKDICKGVKDDFREISVLSDYEVVNGIPGMLFVQGIKRNTSGGFPMMGPKTRYLIDQVEEGYPEGVMYSPEVMDRIGYIQDILKNDTCYNPISVNFMKDEPVKKKKRDEQVNCGDFSGCPFDYSVYKYKPTRAFFGASADWAFIFKKYYGMAIRFIHMRPILFECLVGIDVSSADWSLLYNYLTKFGSDRIIAGDYSKFDKKLCAQLLLYACTIMYKMLCKSGNFTVEQLVIAKTMIFETCHPTVLIDHNLCQLPGSLPSGHPATVIINSICNSLLMRMCFIKCGYDVEKFKNYVNLATYGDDNIAGVSSEVNFGMVEISYHMKSLGQKYTMFDKSDEIVDYSHISDVNFLQRSFVEFYYLDSKYIISPLNFNSMLKMITLGTKSQLSMLQQIEINVDKFLDFLCLYGRQKFYYYGNMLEIICLQKHIPIKDVDFDLRFQRVVDHIEQTRACSNVYLTPTLITYQWLNPNINKRDAIIAISSIFIEEILKYYNPHSIWLISFLEMFALNYERERTLKWNFLFLMKQCTLQLSYIYFNNLTIAIYLHFIFDLFIMTLPTNASDVKILVVYIIYFIQWLFIYLLCYNWHNEL